MITPAQRDAMLRYEELKVLESETKKAINELKPDILEIMLEEEQVESDGGTFKLAKKKNWKFSAEHNVLEERLNELKETEIAVGTAKDVGTPYFKYTARKR